MDKIFASAGKPKPKPAGGDAPSEPDPADSSKPLPKGVVLGKDGKPCRSCTSVRDWMAMARAESGPPTSSPSSSSPSSSTTAAASSATSLSALTAAAVPADCPPDVDELGRGTWTLLHGMTATYPDTASAAQQADMRQFLGLLARLYPCWVCAEDFDAYMATPRGRPALETRDAFGTWMCRAHNEVNAKLGKPQFDCARWAERWRDGWKDGSCG